jgi:hypothetical protein
VQAFLRNAASPADTNGRKTPRSSKEASKEHQSGQFLILSRVYEVPPLISPLEAPRTDRALPILQRDATRPTWCTTILAAMLIWDTPASPKSDAAPKRQSKEKRPTVSFLGACG